jgi:hypothetical protein
MIIHMEANFRGLEALEGYFIGLILSNNREGKYIFLATDNEGRTVFLLARISINQIIS